MNFLIFTLILCVFAITTGEFVIAGILPQVAHDLHVSISAAGLLVTAYAIGMIVGGPVLTALTAHFSRRPLVMSLIVIAILGNIFSAIAPDYTSLFVARVITALVTSTFFANAIIIATSHVADNKKASVIAKLAFGMNIAMIIGVPLGTWIGGQYGWRFTFIAIAGLGLIGLLLMTRFVPHVTGSKAEGSVFGELKVLKERSVWLAISLTALGNAGILAVFTFLAHLLTDVTGFQPSVVATLLLIYGVGATIGNLLGGWLADRSLGWSQVALLATMAVSLLFMWIISPNQSLTTVMIFLIGIISFAVIPGMQTRVLLAASQAPTLAIAVNASAYQLAAAFAGWYGGKVIEHINLRGIYVVAATVTFLGVILSFYILRQEQAKRERDL